MDTKKRLREIFDDASDTLRKTGRFDTSTVKKQVFEMLDVQEQHTTIAESFRGIEPKKESDTQAVSRFLSLMGK